MEKSKEVLRSIERTQSVFIVCAYALIIHLSKIAFYEKHVIWVLLWVAWSVARIFLNDLKTFFVKIYSSAL